MPPPKDDRSLLSQGIAWATTITSLGLEMALPCMGGYFFDRYFGTLPWGLVVGAILGFVLGMYQLIVLAAKLNNRR